MLVLLAKLIGRGARSEIGALVVLARLIRWLRGRRSLSILATQAPSRRLRRA